jgi:hypothetical protein
VIRIAKPSTIRRWLETKLAKYYLMVQIPTENALLRDLERTENQHAKPQALVGRYTSLGASAA